MASSDEEAKKEPKMLGSTGEWSNDAVFSLLQSYGQKFAVGRGFLRNKDWEDVVAAVNSRCDDARLRKTMKQCRDKVDSLKKRYKVEKRRALNTGLCATAWPYFAQMDEIMASKDSGSIPGESPARSEGKRLQLAEDCSYGLGRENKGSSSSPAKGLFGTCDETEMEALGLGLGFEYRKRRRDSVEALTEAIVGFSDMYARMEIAKMEILSNMNVQLAKLGRRKKRRNCHASDTE